MRYLVSLLGGGLLSVLIVNPAPAVHAPTMDPMMTPFTARVSLIAARLNDQAVGLFEEYRGVGIAMGVMQEQLGLMIAFDTTLRLREAEPDELGQVQEQIGQWIAKSTRLQLARKGKLDEAFGYFTVSNAIDPFFATNQFNCAVVYAEKGIYDKALSHLRWAVSLDPDMEAAKEWLSDFEAGFRA